MKRVKFSALVSPLAFPDVAFTVTDFFA